MEKVRRNASAYYFLQGLAVIGWWIVLLSHPPAVEWFRLEEASLVSLWVFSLPDLLLVGPGSIAAALLIYQRSRYAEPTMWLVTGAIVFATLYTTAFAMNTGFGWLGVLLMIVAAIWSGVFATGITVGGKMFRLARPSSSAYTTLKTFVQIVVVWSIILVVLPYLITMAEDRIGIVRTAFYGQGFIASILFVIVSIPGVWSAAVLARKGGGTPLPLDQTNHIVTDGPYAHVRNPMAVSGIGQGLAVALFMGSPSVAVYALMGSAIWQTVFRPLEEDDLAMRFGLQYEHYRRSVRCWIPKIDRFRSENAAIKEMA
jgi:protein-S-isoprenylcysteine O-methyltransferase Ste14